MTDVVLACDDCTIRKLSGNVVCEVRVEHLE